jgi:hypothetical protein
LLRAAAVGGGAYAMGKHAERKQAAAQEDAYYAGQQDAMTAAPPPQAAPPAPGGVSSDNIARLQELGKLHEQGILTDEEFAQQKKLILGI